ncbi:MAG: methionine synthase [Anaerolineales bacterium]|nr:methionine synthase [Anaerolineales bacterium]
MKTIISGALGECVHVAGVTKFLQLAEKAGWKTHFLGPAVSIQEMLQVVRNEFKTAVPGDEILVGVSYRLTPETGERLLGEFAEEASELHEAGVRFVFGGTPPVAERAKKIGFFERTFDGTEPVEATLAYLKDQSLELTEEDFPQTAIGRIMWKSPYPILRHHFGLPTMEASRKGIQAISQAGALDVISLGIDQDAQENFYHPERQDPRMTGAGGVPVRSQEDYQMLFKASRFGNFPLLRTYSGTDDFLRLAEMYVETINIAWCAIPLFWFNDMDGRGPWDLEGSIGEHQKVMSWYGQRSIPVELNEPHHWGMRDAPDTICVTSAYLSAYNAKSFGVRDYIAQLMFNSPAGLSDKMDLAKMLAILELVEPLTDDSFHLWKQTRTGLLSYPVDEDAARAHLSASIYLQMALRPHILHIVGHTEADHAATAKDIIAASKMARRAIDNALGQPDMTQDSAVQARKEELVSEAKLTLEAIQSLAPSGVRDPLTDPSILAKSVSAGILDAPQLKNNRYAKGDIVTRINQNGACIPVDPGSGKVLTEKERLAAIRSKEIETG